jgi:hypothetical protein
VVRGGGVLANPEEFCTFFEKVGPGEGVGFLIVTSAWTKTPGCSAEKPGFSSGKGLAPKMKHVPEFHFSRTVA